MMHYEEIVAVLCDTNKKPLRELDSQRQDSGRRAKVVLPFDSEYQIMIKNNSDRRIKLNIDIDGTNVTSNGLIMNAHETDYIERFVDVAKKFKFVKSTNENVADPTNFENGVVKIRIHKEKYCFGPLSIMNSRTNIYYSQPTIHQYDFYSTPCSYTTYSTSDASYRSVNNGDMVGSLQSGATVEGGNSNQNFSSTYWLGDEDQEIVFTFNLFGTDNTEKAKKLEEYLKLKKELGL